MAVFRQLHCTGTYSAVDYDVKYMSMHKVITLPAFNRSETVAIQTEKDLKQQGNLWDFIVNAKYSKEDREGILYL